MSTADIKRQIMELQDVQRVNPQSSPVWQQASRELQPLFIEMAKRFPVNQFGNDK